MHISEIRDSKYLKQGDVSQPKLVTIKTLTEENVAMEGKPEDLKWAIHFDELDKPMILNSTNAQLIAMALGSEETDEWSGQQIVLYKDPNVSFGGKLVGGIRVRAPKKGTVAPSKAKPAPEKELIGGEPEDDDIPF